MKSKKLWRDPPSWKNSSGSFKYKLLFNFYYYQLMISEWWYALRHPVKENEDGQNI